MEKKKIDRDLIKTLLPFVVLLFCEIFFFRNILTTDLLFGDDGDGKLCTLITEHWYQVLKGQKSFDTLGIFYPLQGTIAYSDMMLGYAPVYCILRALHFNMFFSYKWTLIIYHVFGALTMYGMLHHGLKVRREWAVIGTISFSISSGYAMMLLHTQLVIISLVPLMLWFVIGFVDALYKGNRLRKNICALAAVFMMGVLMYTGWYVAFFTILFIIFFIICYCVVSLCGKKSIFIKQVKEFFNKIGWDILLYIVFALFIIVPFLMLYIPVLKLNGGRVYEGIVCFIPQFVDLINVTPYNLCMGWMFDTLHLADRSLTSEVWQGYSLITWLLFLVLSVCGLQKMQKKSEVRIMSFSVLLAVLFSILFTVQIGEEGFSLWYWIFKLIPGAASIRAVGRYLLFLLIPVSILIAVFGSRCSDAWMAKLTEKYRDHKAVTAGYGIAVLLLFALMFMGSIMQDGVMARWSETEELQFLSEVPPPPSDCESFFVMVNGQSENGWIGYNVQAMAIAAYYSLDTLNGYTGVFPDGSNGLVNIFADDYLGNVSRWIRTKEIKNVYAYNLTTYVWTKVY